MMLPIELVSIVVPVTHDLSDVAQPYQGYRRALAQLGRPVEFIYVLDGPLPQTAQALRTLKSAGEPIEILFFATPFGEAAALTVGFRHPAGDIVLTLTPYATVQPEALPRLIDALANNDLVVARRLSAEGHQLPTHTTFGAMVNALFGT